jgi:hypothetical protein
MSDELGELVLFGGPPTGRFVGGAVGTSAMVALPVAFSGLNPAKMVLLLLDGSADEDVVLVTTGVALVDVLKLWPPRKPMFGGGPGDPGPIGGDVDVEVVEDEVEVEELKSELMRDDRLLDSGGMKPPPPNIGGGPANIGGAVAEVADENALEVCTLLDRVGNKGIEDDAAAELEIVPITGGGPKGGPPGGPNGGMNKELDVVADDDVVVEVVVAVGVVVVTAPPAGGPRGGGPPAGGAIIDVVVEEEVVDVVEELLAEIVSDDELLLLLLPPPPPPGPPNGGMIGGAVGTLLDEPSSVVATVMGWNICLRGSRCHQCSVHGALVQVQCLLPRQSCWQSC